MTVKDDPTVYHAIPDLAFAVTGGVGTASRRPEVIGALRGRALPDGVHLADFGIRGTDLAHRLLEGYDAALVVDAVPRGERPGTVSVIEPVVEDLDAAPEAHAMDPVKVLALAAGSPMARGRGSSSSAASPRRA
jgi:hypothetical protein